MTPHVPMTRRFSMALCFAFAVALVPTISSTQLTLPTIAVGQGPEAVLFDGTNIWVASQFSNIVTKIGLSGAVAGSVRVGTRPVAMAFDGTKLWVANLVSNDLTMLRASDGNILARLRAGNGP